MFFGAWSLLLIHVQFTPSEGPQTIKICVFHRSNHGSVTMGKGHMTWDKFVIHDVNNP